MAANVFSKFIYQLFENQYSKWIDIFFMAHGKKLMTLILSHNNNGNSSLVHMLYLHTYQPEAKHFQSHFSIYISFARFFLLNPIQANPIWILQYFENRKNCFTTGAESNEMLKKGSFIVSNRHY